MLVIITNATMHPMALSGCSRSLDEQHAVEDDAMSRTYHRDRNQTQQGRFLFSETMVEMASRVLGSQKCVPFGMIEYLRHLFAAGGHQVRLEPDCARTRSGNSFNGFGSEA